MLARLHRPNKFVSTIWDEIDDLALTLDREEVTAELYEGKFHEHDSEWWILQVHPPRDDILCEMDSTYAHSLPVPLSDSIWMV